MSQDYGVTPNDIFNSMKDRFRAEGAAGISSVFGYDITDAGRWKLTVKDGGMSIDKTDDLSGCDVKLITDSATYVGINIGKIDGMQALSAGKLKVEGDIFVINQSCLSSPRPCNS